MIGYAGMNNTLREREPPVRANKTMQKKTWEQKGLQYAGELAVQNFKGLMEILRWNVEHDIMFYRPASKLVPWHSQFDITDLPQYDELRRVAEQCGNIVQQSNMRLTFHPSHWCKLASKSNDTIERSLTTIENHAVWFDLMGLNHSQYYSVNVHIGGHYGDKNKTAERLLDNISELSSNARSHLVLENDDKKGLWSARELVQYFGDEIPITFDYHHHKFTTDGLTYKEAFEQCADTWNTTPLAHYSESALVRGQDAKPQKHSEYVYDIPRWLIDDADVMVESRAKEDSVLQFRERTLR